MCAFPDAFWELSSYKKVYLNTSPPTRGIVLGYSTYSPKNGKRNKNNHFNGSEQIQCRGILRLAVFKEGVVSFRAQFFKNLYGFLQFEKLFVNCLFIEWGHILSNQLARAQTLPILSAPVRYDMRFREDTE